MSTPTLPIELPHSLDTYKTYKFSSEAIQRATEGALSRVPEGDVNALVVYGNVDSDKGWGVAVATKFKGDWTVVVAAAAEKDKPVGVEASVVHSW